MAQTFADVDYFPSYEIIASHPMRAIFFEADMRNVSPSGVDFVMAQFFREHQQHQTGMSPLVANPVTAAAREEDLICEEELLAFEQLRATRQGR
jgi:hypothetical protein